MRFFLIPFALLAAASAFCQEARPKEEPKPSFYKIEISLRDLSDPSAKSVRRFVLHADSPGRGTLRTGTRIAVPTASSGTPMAATQYQYMDVGINIDCRLREQGGILALSSDFEVSLLDKIPPSPAPPPAVIQLRSSVTAPVTSGRPVVLTTIEDPATLKKFEIEATVTQVK